MNNWDPLLETHLYYLERITDNLDDIAAFKELQKEKNLSKNDFIVYFSGHQGKGLCFRYFGTMRGVK